MGNCLVHHGVIRIMKTDGEILKYNPPVKVHDVLASFDAHAIYDDFHVYQCLPLDTQLRCGCLYYLLPVAGAKEAPEKSNPSVRIKVVITKQELKEMLAQGRVPVDEMIARLQLKPFIRIDGNEGGGSETHGGWRPVLQSIPEGGTLS